MQIRDGDWTLWNYDFHSGVQKWVTRDERGNLVMRTDYPHQATVDENAAARSAAGNSWAGDWHRVASIPLPLFYQSGLAQAQTEGDQRFISRWLNDGDNRAFRTKEGKV